MKHTMPTVDITDFARNANTRDYQDSIARSGNPDIANVNWQNAMNAPWKFIVRKNSKAARKYFGEIVPVWGRYTIPRLNALFIQYISSHLQEIEYLGGLDNEGAMMRASGNIIKGDDGRIYFLLYS